MGVCRGLSSTTQMGVMQKVEPDCQRCSVKGQEARTETVDLPSSEIFRTQLDMAPSALT